MKISGLRKHCLITSVLLLAMLPVRSIADGVQCVTSSEPAGEAEEAERLPSCEALFPEVLYQSDSSPWRIGFGAGYGQRSNPLINSDDIPVYGIIQLSWFGERFFFDNGDVGAFLWENPKLSVNLIAGVGGERSFFSYLNDSSISFSPAAGLEGLDGGALDGEPPAGEIVIEPEAPDRDYVIDGGLELIYHGQQTEIQLQLLNDISDKHNGQEAWLSIARPRRYGRWEFNPSVGVTWLSSDAANYYFGVKDSEAMPGLSAYKVGNAFNYFTRFSLNYHFDDHWQMVSVWQYEKLDGDISSSSSVEEDYVETAFVGLYYEF
jgi:outer membrane protein